MNTILWGRALWAIARREILERRGILFIAPVIGLIPFLCLPVARAAGFRTQDALRPTILLVLILFTGPLAAAVGSTALSRDLLEKRLGFYFARPISGITLWTGKLLGTLLVVLDAAVLCLLPGMLFDPSLVTGFLEALHSFPAAPPVATVILFVSVYTFLIALGAVMTPILRIRTAWLLVDFVMLAAMIAFVIGAVFKLGRASYSYGNREIFDIGLLVTFMLAVGAMLLASLLALTRGRTHADRARAFLSITLWSILTPGTGLVFALTHLLTTPDLRDLEFVLSAHPAPRGPWISIEGATRYAGAAFLVNAETGQWRHGSARAFSEDGNRAAWTTRQGTLFVADLTADEKEPLKFALEETFSRPEPQIIFLKDGSRIALVTEQWIAIHDLPDFRQVASVRHAEGVKRGQHGQIALAFFTRRQTLRFHKIEGDIFELDIPTQRIEKVGATGKEMFVTTVDPAANRLLTDLDCSAVVHDGRSGAALFGLDRRDCEHGFVAMMNGGSLVSGESSGGKIRLRTFDQLGKPEDTIEVGEGSHVGFLGQDSESRARVYLVTRSEQVRKNVVVDLDTKAVRDLGSDLSGPFPISGRPASPVRPFFLERHAAAFGGSLIRVDPLSGATRTLVKRKANKRWRKFTSRD